MELIYISEFDNNIILYADKHKCYGYKFNKNKITTIDKDIINYFKLFSLSNNYTKLTNQSKYEVYLDNDTNLKHYFIDGVEDLKLLFINNGQDAILYLGNNKSFNINSSREFKIRNKKIICTLTGLILILNLLPHNIVKTKESNPINDYEISDICNMINESENLTIEEKKYLYNPDFINDVLLYINESDYLKYRLNMRLNDLKIKSYIEDELGYTNTMGYYDGICPNTLFIKNYEYLNDRNMNTIAHEYVHLWQYIGGYNLITESCAEIISNEYFQNASLNTYYDQVKLIKILMEIIGTEPVWYYNFTGDFSQIEERVRPHLTDSEYNEFINDLTFDYNNSELNKPKYDSLKKIFAKLYYEIYKDDINNDLIISLIEKENKSLVRYYFNSRYIDSEHSYYLDYENESYVKLSYQEATENGLVYIFATTREALDEAKAFTLIENGNYNIGREIDMKSADITILRKTDSSKGTIISAFINKEKYTDVNIDDLAKEGIIKVNYSLVDQRLLTGDEYMNHEYRDDAEIYLLHLPSTKTSNDCVEGYIPKKVYLPTINTRYLSIDTKILKKGE